MSRQLTFEQLPKRRAVFIGLRKHTDTSWIIDNTSDCFRVKIDNSVYKSSSAYVFRIAINEFYCQIQCDLSARFTTKELAMEYMETGRINCIRPCTHYDKECKQKRKRIVNESLNWQYTYFVLFNKKVTFRPYTDMNGVYVSDIITH
jgi:hypothetical protein